MCEIISFQEHKQKLERKREKAFLIAKMNTEISKDEADLTGYQLIDLFAQKYCPDIYWMFDLFINGKLE